MRWNNYGPEFPRILHRLKSLGYVIFDDHKDYNLNLIGVRSKSREPGRFDDHFHVVYREHGDWIEEVYECTTDPSAEQHLDPTNAKGVAILKAGQYRGVWKLDLHRGKYLALCQRGAEVTVFRDRNRDRYTDMGKDVPQETGWFGINCHRAHKTKLVETTKYYSSGCQVLWSPMDWARLITLAACQVAHGLGDSFSYSLVEE
tara:strand:- start:1261 stop:1866 length:606 start_codon:yes stop_codon:yes gene_type:complete